MKKLTSLALLLFLIITTKCFSQKYSQISKAEIYSFINTGFFTKKYKSILIREPIRIELSDTLLIFNDSIFSPIDNAFLKQQIISKGGFKWEAIKNLKLMDKASDPFSFWSKHNNNFKTFTGVAEMSIPLFSVDKSKCMINFNWFCGEMCGDGGFYYYQKIKRKWELITRLHNSYR